MRAFVAGATGYTGREVVRELCSRGVATTAHVRPDSSRLEEWRSRFGELSAAVDSTPWEPAAMTESLRRVAPDLVFALLGTTRARGRAARRSGRAETYETVDYGLTALLIAAATEVQPLPRFIYLSSVGVRGDTRNAYLLVRARVERELRASGLPWVIARPSFISGPDRDERRPAERIGARVADGLLGLASLVGAPSLLARFGSTTSAELARALVRLGLDLDRRDVIVEAAALRDPG